MGKVSVESVNVRVGTSRNHEINIACDVLRPVGTENLPTVMIMGRYWRSFRLRFFPQPPNQAPIGPRDPIADALLKRGFAVVVVDARGTGASEGIWEMFWSDDEVQDYSDVVEWITKQPWSNGKVGATGISYEGSTAIHLASTGHPAVRAVVPRSFEFDILKDIVAVGGVRNASFLKSWSESVALLDQNVPPPMFGFTGRLMVSGVKRVDDDKRGKSLAKIIENRKKSSTLTVYESLNNVMYLEDTYGKTAKTLRDVSPKSKLDKFKQYKVPMQLWASWMDGTTARSLLEIFETLSQELTCEVWIGAYNHEGKSHASCGQHGKLAKPALSNQWDSMISFLEHHMASDELLGSQPPKSTIHYFVMNQEEWKTSETWPPVGTEVVHLKFTGDRNAMEWNAADRTDLKEEVFEWTASMKSTTGKRNRWYTQLALPVQYNNRKKQEKHMCVFYSRPFERDTEITGVVTLDAWVSVSSPQVAIYAYVELVDGSKVKYITECTARMDYINDDGIVDYHRPLEAREVKGARFVSLSFLPTSVLFRRGNKLRIGFCAADSDSFDFVPGVTKLHVANDKPFFLSIPTIVTPKNATVVG